VIAVRGPASGRVGQSLTAACMHTAPDVFVILKAGRPARIARHERALPLIIDPCPDKQASNECVTAPLSGVCCCASAPPSAQRR
jgi:hypothetical protein